MSFDMSFAFPELTSQIIPNLKITEVLSFYDFALTTRSKDSTGKEYLTWWYDKEYKPEYVLKYFIVELDSKDIDRIIDNKIDIYSVFFSGIAKKIYRHEEYPSKGITTRIQASQIDKNCLPSPGVFLDL